MKTPAVDCFVNLFREFVVYKKVHSFHKIQIKYYFSAFAHLCGLSKYIIYVDFSIYFDEGAGISHFIKKFCCARFVQKLCKVCAKAVHQKTVL